MRMLHFLRGKVTKKNGSAQIKYEIFVFFKTFFAEFAIFK
jgi:hypothetical protein